MPNHQPLRVTDTTRDPAYQLKHRKALAMADDQLDEKALWEQVPLHLDLIPTPVYLEDPNGNPAYLFGQFSGLLSRLITVVRFAQAYPAKGATIDALIRATAFSTAMQKQWECDSSVYSIRKRPPCTIAAFKALTDVVNAALAPFGVRIYKTRNPYQGYGLTKED